jgi:hypothetical protein
MKTILAVLLLTTSSGCAIADRSDKFGAEFDFAIGGLLSYIVDLRFKGSIGFSKTCKEKDDESAQRSDTDPLGNLRGFL